MAQPKFTPGPWQAYIRLGEAPRITSNSYGTCVVVADVQGAHRADLQESAANARLIAAAPDLYAALQWAMRQIKGPARRVRGQNDAYCDGYEAAHAALRKADGDAP